MTREKIEAEKTFLARLLVGVGLTIFLLSAAQNLLASELVHRFGNPSFSGINQSAHYLTIDEQELNFYAIWNHAYIPPSLKILVNRCLTTMVFQPQKIL